MPRVKRVTTYAEFLAMKPKPGDVVTYLRLYDNEPTTGALYLASKEEGKKVDWAMSWKVPKEGQEPEKVGGYFVCGGWGHTGTEFNSVWMDMGCKSRKIGVFKPIQEVSDAH